MRRAMIVFILMVLAGGCRMRTSDTEGQPHRPSVDELREICPF